MSDVICLVVHFCGLICLSVKGIYERWIRRKNPSDGYRSSGLILAYPLGSNLLVSERTSWIVICGDNDYI